MSAGDWLESAIINHFFRNSTVTSPTTLYLALFTVEPGDDGTGGAEVVGGSYARQVITLSADTDGVSSNTTALDYANMPECDVVSGGIFTAVSGGNYMGGAPFSSTRSVTAGATFTVPIGDVIVRVR